MNQLGLTSLPAKMYHKTNEEVIKFIAENLVMIMNYLYQLPQKTVGEQS
jgi:hypothetical protein